MATQFLMPGLMNAAFGVALAVLLGLGLKWRRNAQWAAVLWILVLLKFISPPLASIAIERPVDEPTLASKPADDTAASRHLPPNNTAATTHSKSNEAVLTPLTPSPEPVKPTRVVSRPEVEIGNAPSVNADPAHATTVSVREILWRPDWIASAWLLGGVIAFAWLIVSGIRFRRTISNPQLAGDDPELSESLAMLCRRWNIRQVPKLRVVDARVSPMVWTWFDETTLVVPRSLLASLSPAQRELLLAHELAHLLRRDHLVRWLEAAVQSLYWWLPVVPWVRRQLHAAQEECCDAFVQREFPTQSVDYCDTLVAASTWLQGVPPAPVWASELGTATGLKQRIQTILEQKLSRPISRRAMMALATLGLIVCVVSVRWVQAEPATAEQQDGVDAEFLVTDEQGAAVPSGTLHLRGYYDNNDFLELERPIENGRATYHFQRPRLRELRIGVSAQGFLSHSHEDTVEGTDRGFPVEQKYAIRLKPGVPIGGKVVDENDRPLQGVHVFLSTPSVTRDDGSRDSVESWFQTDADGKWSCPGTFPDMSDLSIRLEHATHVDESSDKSWPHMRRVEADEFAALRAQTHVSRMHEDPPLVGKVVDSAGQPVAGVTVDISGRNSGWSQHYARGMVIKTNDAGEFSLPRPPSGDQRLTLMGPGSHRQVVEFAVDLSKPLTVTLTEGRRMEFLVLDTAGQPIQGITFIPEVTGSEFRGKTDADGRWVWDNAPDEAIRYQITSGEYLCQLPDANYGPDDSPVTLTLRRNLPVIGQVIDAETGEPIREFRLYKGSHFKANSPGMWEWSMETTQSRRPVKGSWAEGKVSAQPGTSLTPGEFQNRLYTLDRLIRYRVQADGYLPEVSAELDAAVLPDETIKLQFRLKKYSGIIRNVLTPDGDPAVGAQVVTLVKRGNDDRARLTIHNGRLDETSIKQATVHVECDAAGRFDLPVHNDPFVCLITHTSGYLEVADRELGPSPELTLLPWRAVEGSISVQGGPAENVNLYLHSSSNHLWVDHGAEVPGVLFSLAATTDSDGRFHSLHGTSGTWDVRISYPSPVEQEHTDAPAWERPSPWRSSHFEIDIVGEGATRLDVGRDCVDIIGRVIVPEGVTPDWLYSGVQIHCDRQSDGHSRSHREFYEARLAEDGTFRCWNVPPGDYEGQAVVGEADDRILHYANAARKRGFEGRIRLSADMFDGKSTTDPIDIGEITLEKVQ